MDKTAFIKIISERLGHHEWQVENTIRLIDDGATIPFISRYRKEMTGGATDEQLREFEEIYAYSKKLLQRKEQQYL